MASRRSFIKKTAVTFSASLITPKSHLFSIFKSSPLKQVNIGVIGTGDRGQGLIKLISKIEMKYLLYYKVSCR